MGSNHSGLAPKEAVDARILDPTHEHLADSQETRGLLRVYDVPRHNSGADGEILEPRL